MLFMVRGVPDWLKSVRARCSVIIVVVVILLGSQSVYGQRKDEPAQKTNEKIQQLASLARTRSVDATVGAGDLLHIDVFDVPELSRDVRVSDTGNIGYPLIPGKIIAAGQTPFQLQSKLEQLLVENGLVSHPQVSVFVKEQVSQPITVVGAVNHPMVYQVIRPTTLLEVLAAAGGITDTAGSIVTITRAPGPGTELSAAKSDSKPAMSDVKASTDDPPLDPAPDAPVITIQLQDLLESGNAAFNIPVYGGDVISVPRAGIIYVMGAGISQPGGYVVQEHGQQITVLKAIALAHGLNGFAKANDAVIFRRNPVSGQNDPIPVRVKQIEHNKTEDVPLQSNDILYIPDSAGKRALARGVEASILIGSALIIYGAHP